MDDFISDRDIREDLRQQLETYKPEAIPVVKAKKKKRGIRSREDYPQNKKRKNRKHLTEEAKDILSAAMNATEIQRPPRPPPKLIVFEEPGRSKEKSLNHSLNKLKDTATSVEDSEGIDFLKIARDVKRFGMTGFTKRERRLEEQQRAQALGAKAPKGVKMSYNIFLARREKQKAEEAKSLKLERAMGMSTNKNKSQSKSKKAPIRSTGWWRDKSTKGFEASVGKYKNGVQTLSKADIRRIKRKAK